MRYLFITMAFLFACGKDREIPNETPVSFNLPDSQGLVTQATNGGFTNLDGGLMVFAVNQNGNRRRAFAVTANEASGSRSYLNDNWIFYGVGWDGLENGKMTGTMKCAVANNGEPINLSGAPESVDLHFSAAKCLEGDLFIPSSVGSDFLEPYDLAIESCKRAEVIAARSATSSEHSSDYCTNTNNFAYKAQFIRVELPNYAIDTEANVSLFPKPSNRMLSNCYGVASGFNYLFDTELEIPTGNILSNYRPFYTKIYAFTTEANCNAMTGGIVYNIPKGLDDAHANQDDNDCYFITTTNINGDDKIKIYLNGKTANCYSVL